MQPTHLWSFENRMEALENDVALDFESLLLTALEVLHKAEIFNEEVPWLFETLSWRVVVAFEDGVFLSILKDDGLNKGLLLSWAKGDPKILQPKDQPAQPWLWSDSAGGWRVSIDVTNFAHVNSYVSDLCSQHGKPMLALPWMESTSNLIKGNDRHSSEGLQETFASLILRQMLNTEPKVLIEICSRNSYLGRDCGINRFEALLAELNSNAWNASISNSEDHIDAKPALPIFEEYNGYCTSAAGDFNFVDENGLLFEFVNEEQLVDLAKFCDRFGFTVVDNEEFVGIVSKDFDLESLS
jgi:hypothetical protein